jgi:hypothetical protein
VLERPFGTTGDFQMVKVFSEDDKRFIQNSVLFLGHLVACPSCCDIAKRGDGLMCINSIFSTLNAIGDENLLAPDYFAALIFCREWLERHGLEIEIENLDYAKKPH